MASETVPSWPFRFIYDVNAAAVAIPQNDKLKCEMQGFEYVLWLSSKTRSSSSIVPGMCNSFTSLTLCPSTQRLALSAKSM